MKESEKETLFGTIKDMIDGIIEDKKLNPKNTKLINNFKIRLNIGLQPEENEIMWVHLIAENGNYIVGKEKLDEYDLEIVSDPMDMLFFCNGEYSVVHMALKKNQFGNRKLLFKGGTTGLNLGKLLKLPKVLVLDKQ